MTCCYTVRLDSQRPLDRNSPIPLYFQIAQNLKQAITDGTLKRGDRLGNELDLTQRLGVSRPTVRQAVQRLVDCWRNARHPRQCQELKEDGSRNVPAQLVARLRHAST